MIQSAEKSEILDLVYRYAWLIDEKQFDEWLDLFTDDASYVVTTQENARAGLEFGPIMERKDTLRERIGEYKKLWWVDPAVTSHIVSNPLIEVTDSTHAEVKCYITLYRSEEHHVTELQGCAKCWLALEKREGEWKIRSFKAVFDADIIPGVLDIPV